MVDFVVGLVEERVDLGGSQFSESILERWYSAHASQQNVVAHRENGSFDVLSLHSSARHVLPPMLCVLPLTRCVTCAFVGVQTS